jgi:hypothetical protein
MRRGLHQRIARALLLFMSTASCDDEPSGTTPPQCCKLGTPSCGCSVIGTRPDGTCQSVCDAVGDSTPTIDERGCPRYVIHGSCLDKWRDSGVVTDSAKGPSCSDCQKGQCGAEQVACQATPEALKGCNDLIMCINACPDTPCADACIAKGSAEGKALLDCVQSKCAEACSG